MGEKVIHLVPQSNERPPIDGDIIEMLQGLLASAQAGNITGIAIVWNEGPDDMPSTCFSYADTQLALGAVAILHHDILSE